MTDYQQWLDRIDNLLQIQRDRCFDLVSANFTRRELIELKMMIEVLMEKVLEEREPKIGYWERTTDKAGHLVWECKCGWQQRFYTKYCPDCGAKMSEIPTGSESEDKG